MDTPPIFVARTPKMINLLLDHGANPAHVAEGVPPLLHSYILGLNLSVLEVFHTRNLLTFPKDKDGKTLLHEAARWGKIDVVEFLVNHGAHLNERDNEGNTPLHYAVVSGQFNCVDYLISEGSDVESVNNRGETPLHASLQQFKQDLNIVDLILNSGAPVDAQDCEGNTALHLIMQSFNMDILKMIISYGADTCIKNSAGKTAYASRARNMTYYDDEVSRLLKTYHKITG